MHPFKLAKNHKFSGVPEIIICSLFLSIMVAIVRDLGATYHIFFIVLMRNIFGTLILIPKFLKHQKTLFSSKNIYLHFLRSANGTISMFLWFYAIVLLPISEAISLSFLTPLITTLASSFFLNEKVNKNIFIACFISFIGVLIILRPGFNEFKIGYIFCFGSILLWTLSNLIVKTMTKTDKTRNIVAQMTIYMLIFSIPFALPYLQAISFVAGVKFLILGILSNQCYRLIAQAYKKNDLAVLQPFDFSRLIFASIIAYIFFGETPDFFVFLGSLIILIGILISIKKPTKKHKKALQ
jgi:drug/metabolite transporter (DMT)-like permease